MLQDPRRTGVATSPAHDAFQLMFDTVDVFSSAWQPSYKGVGRWQLELAHLGAQQGRANMEFGHRLMRCLSPIDLVTETMKYWQQSSQNFSQATQNMTSAAARAVPPPVAFASPFEVLALPGKKVHDTIRLPDNDEPELPFERQVA